MLGEVWVRIPFQQQGGEACRLPPCPYAAPPDQGPGQEEFRSHASYSGSRQLANGAVLFGVGGCDAGRCGGEVV